MRVFSAPSRYIQGPGLLDRLGELARGFGPRCTVVVDAEIRPRFGARIEASFAAAAVDAAIAEFSHEVTAAQIDRLAEVARAHRADFVVGVGGGKALDAGKGVALARGTRFVSVPTIASTDAPASFAIAVYDDAHVMTEIRQLPRNPELVVVDTQVIAAAPLRFLRAGIGDAISKKFEAEACAAAGANTLHGAPPTHTGQLAANACFEVIRTHGAAALRAIEAGTLNDDVESLIEATVLLSTLGYENGGLSVAHAIARGFPAVPRAARTLHGEHVAYGLLVQFVLEDRPQQFIGGMLDLYTNLGLPRTLMDFAVSSPSNDEIRLLADTAMTSPSVRRFARQLDSEQLQRAILTVESFAA